MIDQRRLPLEEVYLRCTTWQEVADAICNMTVRGAPALGVTAGMGMALAARAALARQRRRPGSLPGRGPSCIQRPIRDPAHRL